MRRPWWARPRAASVGLPASGPGRRAPASAGRCWGGCRASTGSVWPGLDVVATAETARRRLLDSLGGEAAFEHVDVQLAQDAEAIGQLRVTAKDRDAKKVGRAFSNRFIELALSS